MVKLIIATYF